MGGLSVMKKWGITILLAGMMLFAALAGTLGTSYTNSLIGGIIIVLVYLFYYIGVAGGESFLTRRFCYSCYT